MAKLEPWEKRLRAEFRNYVGEVNTCRWLFRYVHETARGKDPSIPDADPDRDPKSAVKLTKFAKQIWDMWTSITDSIRAEEDGDAVAFKEAASPLVDFIDGVKMKLAVGWKGDQLTTSRLMDEAPEEKHPHAAKVADGFIKYEIDHKEVIHLGVCRQCGNVYLKPKHGQKMRYCSGVCRQKAYRERKKVDEA